MRYEVQKISERWLQRLVWRLPRKLVYWCSVRVIANATVGAYSFQRNYETDRLIRDEVVPGAEWVLAGEGIATRKWDGTCVLISGGQMFKRYEVKKGKMPPPDFIPETDVDENTGKQQGWVPVSDGPDDRWHREAFRGGERDGTYELCGPKVQGNPEGFPVHVLLRHGAKVLDGVPRNFEGIRNWLTDADIEGIVFHHPDGRMAKVKGKDFGLRRTKG